MPHSSLYLNNHLLGCCEPHLVSSVLGHPDVLQRGDIFIVFISHVQCCHSIKHIPLSTLDELFIERLSLRVCTRCNLA